MVKSKIINLLKQQTILLILLFLFVFLIIVSPSFREPRNFYNLIRKVSAIGIMSCGLTLPIVSGGLDLSVGSLFSLTGILAVMWSPNGLFIAIVIPIIIACLVGILNGFIISKFNVNPVIVTLGMLSVLQGAVLIITGGGNKMVNPGSNYLKIAGGNFLGISNQTVIFIFIVIVLYILLHRTTMGRYIYLLGSNAEAAVISGIRIDRLRMIAYAISAICAAIAGIVVSSNVSYGMPYAGQGWEFEALTAVLIGGNAIAGGKGSIYNTILGVFMLAIIINGMILLNLPYATQIILKGFLLMLAVILDARSRLREQIV